MMHIEKTMVFSNGWMVVLFTIHVWIASNMEQGEKFSFNGEKIFFKFLFSLNIILSIGQSFVFEFNATIL